jgi:hypothetical protein
MRNCCVENHSHHPASVLIAIGILALCYYLAWKKLDNIDKKYGEGRYKNKRL